MKKLRMAILGAGRIANTMAATIARMPNVQPYAIASRSAARAEAFAQQYGFERAYGSYEEMVRDENIDLVYIATPHSHHAQNALLCVRNGRPVLCEKPFTANAAGAREVLAEARQRGVFIAEALWTRYMPLAQTLRQLVADGVIGQPALLSASFGDVLADVPRLIRPELAGGALLDLGIYPINFASIALGANIRHVVSDAVLYPTGVDAQNCITLHYEDGCMASLSSSFLCKPDNIGRIFGSEGHLVMESVTNFKSIRVFDRDGNETAHYQREPQISGYEYEVDACIAALQQGRLECPQLPHSEILRTMELMDSLRATWGVKYPFE